MTNNPEVSVIMPVYNAEKTIEKSMNSALCQTVQNMEIICIDDGSMDGSIKKIQILQKSHPQILLLKQEHKGAGPARNAGIKAASGRYIAFLDADDELVDTKALESMVQACSEYQADICGSYRVIEVNGQEWDTGLLRQYDIPNSGCFIEYSDFQYDYDYQSFIFDREFLIRNKIWFPAYMRYQDPPFFVKAMSLARRFFVAPVTLYRYRYNPMQQIKVVEKNVSDILRGMRDTLETAEREGYSRLFANIVRRIEGIPGEYHDIILKNLSDEVMAQLLAINEISKRFQERRLNILTEVYQGMRGIDGLACSHDLMWKIVMIKQHKGGFRTYFEENDIQTVAVYGLGVFGRILVNELKACGIKIICGIDRKVKTYGDIPVINPEDEVPDCDVLIVSLMEPGDVLQYYEEKRKVKTCTFVQIIQETVALYKEEDPND